MSALRTWMRWGVWLFALGGALWVLKVTLITVNHLQGRDVDSLGVPVLYITAVALLAIGTPTVAAALLRRRPSWMQVIAAIAAIPALFFLYETIDTLMKSVAADVGPGWLADELGIVATGALCLVGGLLLVRTVGPPRSGERAVRFARASKLSRQSPRSVGAPR